jgi:hypothetical protein
VDACGGKQKAQIPAITFCIFNSRIHNGSKDERPATQQKEGAPKLRSATGFPFRIFSPSVRQKKEKVMRVVVTFHYVRMCAAG